MAGPISFQQRFFSRGAARLFFWDPAETTGLTVTAIAYSRSASQFYDDATGLFDAGPLVPVPLVMSEWDFTNFPGLYSYTFGNPENDPDYLAGVIYRISEPVTAYVEQGILYPFSELITSDVWDVQLADHVVADTTGKKLGDLSLASSIASLVWEEPLAGHNTPGTSGAALDSEIAYAVWDELAASHVIGGSLGKQLGTLPNALDIADQVWDELIAGHVVGGSTAETLANGTLTAANVWDEDLSTHIDGTAGNTLLRTAALRQDNMRIKYTVWNTAGQPTAGTLFIYPDRATAVADAAIVGLGSIGEYSFEATFNGGTGVAEDYIAIREA